MIGQELQIVDCLDVFLSKPNDRLCHVLLSSHLCDASDELTGAFTPGLVSRIATVSQRARQKMLPIFTDITFPVRRRRDFEGL